MNEPETRDFELIEGPPVVAPDGAECFACGCSLAFASAQLAVVSVPNKVEKGNHDEQYIVVECPLCEERTAFKDEQ